MFERLDGDLWLVAAALAWSVPLAALAGRVLGVRRAFAKTLVAAGIGWVFGVVVSLLLASGRADASAEFGRDLLLFSSIGVVAAAAWLEFLARPGLVARAGHGIQSIPRPVRSLRHRSRRVRRYAEITRIAVRHGLGPSLGIGRRDDLAAGRRPPPVRRLRLALEECGGMFVKLGQLVSTRTDLLSPEAADELAHLQDQVRPVGREPVASLLEAELDAPVEEVFAEFEWQPLAAASIGQVYRARLPDGDRVIVKVQRPGIDESVSVDLSVLEDLGELVEVRTSWGAEYRVRDLVVEFSTRLREELDFRIEARNARTIAASLPDDSPVYIPRVYEDLSTARVLVMEWLDGVGVRDVPWDRGRATDRKRLADSLLQAFLERMFQDGVFHADPHPGNVMLLTDGRLALIDFGAAGRLDPVQQAALRELMAGVSRRDGEMVAQAALQVAQVRSGIDPSDFERAVGRFMAQHLSPGARPDAAMFSAMLRLCFDYGVTLPAEWSTFFRALVVLEGTLTTIAPGYSVIDAAEEIAGKWARSRLDPGSVQQAVRDEIMRTIPMIRRLPRHIDRAFTMLERDGLRVRVSRFSDEHDEQVVTRLVNRVVLALVAAATGVFSVGLMAIEGGPPLVDGTSLLRALGYLGLACSVLLSVRVVVSVLRDGLN